jgi:hypothetical protein
MKLIERIGVCACESRELEDGFNGASLYLVDPWRIVHPGGEDITPKCARTRPPLGEIVESIREHGQYTPAQLVDGVFMIFGRPYFGLDRSRGNTQILACRVLGLGVEAVFRPMSDEVVIHRPRGQHKGYSLGLRGHIRTAPDKHGRCYIEFVEPGERCGMRVGGDHFRRMEYRQAFGVDELVNILRDADNAPLAQVDSLNVVGGIEK